MAHAHSNALAVLDLTVLKYLASRGYSEAQSALRRGLGLDDGQVVDSHYDLTAMFAFYINSLHKEAHASSNQVSQQAHAGQVSQQQQQQQQQQHQQQHQHQHQQHQHQQQQHQHQQQHAYDNLLMGNDCQGVGHAQNVLENNGAKRMRASCGRLPMPVTGIKRKMEARMMPANPQSYNQARQLVHLSSGQTLTMDQLRMMHQRNLCQRIRQRNSGVNMSVVNGGVGVGGANMHPLNGVKQTSTGASGSTLSSQHPFGVQEQLAGSGTNSGSSRQIPGLTANLSGFMGSANGNAYGFNGAQQSANNMGAVSALQNNRQTHNPHGLRAMQAGTPHFANGLTAPMHGLTGRASGQVHPLSLPDPGMQVGGSSTSPPAGYLMSNPVPTPRSLHHAMQLQSVPSGVDMHRNIPCAAPISTGSALVQGDRQTTTLDGEETACRGIGGTMSSFHMPGSEKVTAGCMSSTLKDISTSGHSRVISADSVPMSHPQRTGMGMREAKHQIENNLTMNNSTGNGNSSNGGSGQGAFGNSSSASSTDVNGDLGSAVGHIDTPSSDKDATELENVTLKESPLEWESPDMDVGSSAALLSGMSNEMLPMESLGFDSIHGIDTLEAFLNEPGT